jgi:hypothetical protein
MTFGRVLKVCALVALTVLMAVPAGAGPFDVHVYRVLGSRVQGTVRIDQARTATFSVVIRQLQGLGASGFVQLLPTPPVPDPDVPVPPIPLPTQNEGCVEIDAGADGKDRGCIVKSATVTIDPVMLSGQIVLGFESERFEGDLIDVTLLLEGTGNPAASVEEGDPPSASPEEADALNEVLLTREADVLAGSVRSRGLGFRGVGLGGPVISVTQSQMFTGLRASGDFDFSCMVSVSGNCVNP